MGGGRVKGGEWIKEIWVEGLKLTEPQKYVEKLRYGFVPGGFGAIIFLLNSEVEGCDLRFNVKDWMPRTQ